MTALTDFWLFLLFIYNDVHVMDMNLTFYCDLTFSVILILIVYKRICR